MKTLSFFASAAIRLEMPKSFIFYLITYLIKSIEISYLYVILFDLLYKIIFFRIFSFLKVVYLNLNLKKTLL